MAKRSTTINQNRDNDGVASWSDANHDVLFLVMMRLRVVDFVAFSVVCKSWRLFALSERNTFMASKPPMSICIPIDSIEKDCYLKDFEERNFKTNLPHSAGRLCVGLSCGYFILFGKETRDFCLVNSITKHELHFPNVPFDVSPGRVRAILVYSSSIYGWVFVMLHRLTNKIWFSIAGKGAWNHIFSTLPILDLLVFKGKIYTLHTNYHMWDVGHVCEMKLDPYPKLTLLETEKFLTPDFLIEFVSSGENLYVIQYMFSDKLFKVHILDFGTMNWVWCPMTRKEYEYFVSSNRIVVVKRESWVDPCLRYWRDTDIKYRDMWYFPYDCLNVNLIG